MNVSGEKIKKLRKHHGWSQERLAQVSGLSERTIQRIEQGESASMETRLSLANAFDVTPVELCEEEAVKVGSGGVNWSGIGGLVLCALLMYLQFYLPGAPFFDAVSLLLTIGIAAGMAAVSMGGAEALMTVALVRWVFVLPNAESGLQQNLPNLQRMIFYCYSAGAVSTLVGIIAVLMTPANLDANWPYPPASETNMGFGIALLTMLYGAMLAELVFRPLKHRIERMLIEHRQVHQ